VEIYLADLHSEVGREFIYEEDFIPHYEDLIFLEPVHIRLRIINLGREVLVKGNIKTKLSLVCSRCLKDFPYNLEAKIQEIYLWDIPIQRNISPGDIIELKDEDFKFVLEKESLFLDPLIEDSIRLNIPVKPLCRPDCKGLCPVCGKDLNLGECDCSKESKIDPRWEPLKKFLDKKGGK
jgi:uncharacterized protein